MKFPLYVKRDATSKLEKERNIITASMSFEQSVTFGSFSDLKRGDNTVGKILRIIELSEELLFIFGFSYIFAAAPVGEESENYAFHNKANMSVALSLDFRYYFLSNAVSRIQVFRKFFEQQSILFKQKFHNLFGNSKLHV